MTSSKTRRRFLTEVAALAAAPVALLASPKRMGASPEWRGVPSGAPDQARQTAPAAAAGTAISVYKDPDCGCCEAWVTHMKANGFRVTVTNTRDTNKIKREHSVAEPLWSCHTALAGSYVIEGHVPAADVKKLLAQRPPNTVGLTIPGMPQSAPGMDIKPFEPYKVLAFDAKGKTTVFAAHDKPS